MEIRFESFFFLAIVVTFVVNCYRASSTFRYVFVRYQDNLKLPLVDAKERKYSKTIPTFLALFIFGLVYELVLVFDSLRLKSTIQIAGTCLCNLGLVIYGAVQIGQIHTAVDNLIPLGDIDRNTWSEIYKVLLVIPIVNALGTLVMSGCAYKLVKEFRKSIYDTITKSDWQFQKLYRVYQVCR